MNSGSRPSFLRAWTRSSTHILNSVIEANRAAAAAFGVSSEPHSDGGRESESASDRTTESMSKREPRRPVEARIAPDSTLDEWDVECSFREDGAYTVGDSMQFSKTVSESDVVRFAAASGDTNPLHLDGEHAQETRFGERIAHGMLVSGVISAALARLPGTVVYLSQDLEFLKPVRIGERVTADVEVAEDLGGGRLRLETSVLDGNGEIIVDGEATVLIDDTPNSDQ